MKTPVIIPSHNAASTLEATLSALPASEVEPIVAINGCIDNTLEIADNFGARTMIFEDQGKLPAVQGVLEGLGKRALDPLIILDADTRPIVPKRWHRSMLELLMDDPSEKPTIVAGPIVFTSSKIFTAAAYSARSFLLSRRERMKGDIDTEVPQAGPNIGLRLQSMDILSMILELPHTWPGEDRLIVDELRQAGGRYLHPQNLSLFTLTQLPEGYPTILERLTLNHEDRSNKTRNYYLRKAAKGSKPYWL